MFADVIFPAYMTPYFMFLGIFPWAIILALLSEIVIYRAMIKGPSWPAISIFTVGANIFSWIIGGLIAAFLPFDYAMGESDPEHRFWFPAHAILCAFAIAWALSVVLEGGAWRLALRKQSELPIWKATAAANAASYLLLLGLLYVMNHFSLRVEM